MGEVTWWVVGNVNSHIDIVILCGKIKMHKHYIFLCTTC